MAELLDNLNERQREAVLETEGYVRVIAGAGSGKTKLLVSRYAYLVQDYGIDSSNILCVTFTNKAAGEMKKRIQGLIGDGYDVSLICTYHGFCNRLLRENPEKLFLNKQFQIIDSQQQKAILSEIYQKRELKLDYATFEAMLRKIGRAKKDMGYVAKMCNPRPCQILEKIKNQDDEMIEEFLQKQKATYSLDFHDLIAFAIYLLETDSAVREKWQERLNYIMVDEFQDSSAVEMRLVELLSGLYRNLMIVGDPDQNIYEWRGSDVKLLVDFDKEHEPTKTIILNQNYRFTPQILQCANTLIEKNELRLKKDLFTRNPAGAPVIHYHSKDDFEEMDQVIANMKKLRETEGFRYSDFAIIYRAGFLSRIAEKKLAEKNIPYEIFGGVRFYQRMEILDILAYLKLIAYDDDASFQRIVNTPRRRFGRSKMNLLEQLREQEQAYGGRSGRTYDSWDNWLYGDGDNQANESHDNWEDDARDEISLLTALSWHLEDKEFQGSDVGAFVRFIQSMRKSYRERRISDIVNTVTEESGYEQYIRELGDEERLDNLAEFKRIANEFEREFGENLSLEEFLQQIALQSGEDSSEDRDAVKLMTIHSAKGLEFPAVFILGFTEGIFPSSKTVGERKKLGLEEERRLCYVAITRAEKYLFLMESEGVSTNGMKKLVSRFLEEIGEKNYVRIGRISEELKRESKGYTAKLNREMMTEPMGSRAVGDEVEHHIFGKGKILAIDEKRGSYSVQFENMKYPRNISGSYFQKEHVDLRQTSGEEKKEQNKPVLIGDTSVVNGTRERNIAVVVERPEVPESLEKLEETEYPEARWEEIATEQLEVLRRKFPDADETEQSKQLKHIGEAEHPAKAEYAGEAECLGEARYTDEAECPDEAEHTGKAESTSEAGFMDKVGRPDEAEYASETACTDEAERPEEAEYAGEAENPDEVEYIDEAECPEKAEYADEAENPDETEYTNEAECPDEAKYVDKAERLEETGYADSAELSKDTNPKAAQLKEMKENSPNLWKRDDVPHSGWQCVGVEDLGAPVGICQMCGYQIIRYAHQMEHPKYGDLSVGCVCAGRMEGDVAAAKHREAEFKNKQSRRIHFFQRQWKRSKKGNEYLKIDGHVVVLYQFSKNPQFLRPSQNGNGREGQFIWKYSVDNAFCGTAYATREKAMAGVFDALEEIRKK